jgi:hypothetical protein
VEKAPAGIPCERARVVLAIGRVRPLVEARTRQVLISGKRCKWMDKGVDGWVRRGRVGQGADSSHRRVVSSVDSLHESDCGRDHWNRVRTGFEMHTTTAKRTRVSARMDGHWTQVRTGAR